MASIAAPDFSGERLVVCRNPYLATERKRKRTELLDGTERDLRRIQAAVARNAIRCVVRRRSPSKSAPCSTSTRWPSISRSTSPARKEAAIAAEKATDGIYVVRTGLPAERLGDTDTVRSYKSLTLVERAFRCIKTVDLQVRPVHHWRADRVRADDVLHRFTAHLIRGQARP